MRFTLIDLIILIAVVFAISSGYRRGFWLSLAQYAGLVLGVVIGATLAPIVIRAFSLNGAAIQSLVAIMILIVLGTIGSSVGYWVGEPIRLRLLAQPRGGRVDSFAGAVFSALAVLSVSWFLGLSLARIRSPRRFSDRRSFGRWTGSPPGLRPFWRASKPSSPASTSPRPFPGWNRSAHPPSHCPARSTPPVSRPPRPKR